jgi:CRP/FNR family transcriptional regulator, cyclic AMP receptor protein
MKDLLAAHPFFAGLTDEMFATLAGCATAVQHRAGAFLLREGDPADHLHAVRSGRVAIQVHTPDRGAVTLQTVGAGEIVGWSWIVPPHQYRFDAQVIEPAAVLALDAAGLRAACERDPALGFALMKRVARVLAERLAATRVQLLDVYGQPGKR